jgi:hypothetical protein
MLRTAALLALGAVLVQADPKVPTEGLVGHWKLDKVEGDQVADASGKGNAGTLLGGPKISAEVPAKFANAASLSFDGKDDRVNAGESPTLAMKSALTVTAWVRPTGAGADAGTIIVNKEGEYEIGRSPDGTIHFALANDDPGWNFVDTGHALPLGTWTHVAWTYSAAARKLVVYADGKQVYSGDGSGDIADNYADLNQLWIGGRSKEDGTEYFAGQIAEVRLYNRALTAQEVGAVFASTRAK